LLRAAAPAWVVAMLKLTLVSEEPELVHVQCQGQISQIRYQVNDNPLETLLGTDAYKRRVLLNLEAVELLDSSGISWLVVTHKNFQSQGGILVVHTIPPRIHQVLLFTRMDRLLHLAEDEAAARAIALGGKS
jgi:anti-anti-sigma factor